MKRAAAPDYLPETSTDCGFTLIIGTLSFIIKGIFIFISVLRPGLLHVTTRDSGCAVPKPGTEKLPQYLLSPMGKWAIHYMQRHQDSGYRAEQLQSEKGLINNGNGL